MRYRRRSPAPPRRWRIPPRRSWSGHTDQQRSPNQRGDVRASHIAHHDRSSRWPSIGLRSPRSSHRPRTECLNRIAAARPGRPATPIPDQLAISSAIRSAQRDRCPNSSEPSGLCSLQKNAFIARFGKLSSEAMSYPAAIKYCMTAGRYREHLRAATVRAAAASGPATPTAEPTFVEEAAASAGGSLPERQSKPSLCTAWWRLRRRAFSRQHPLQYFSMPSPARNRQKETISAPNTGGQVAKP